MDNVLLRNSKKVTLLSILVRNYGRTIEIRYDGYVRYKKHLNYIPFISSRHPSWYFSKCNLISKARSFKSIYVCPESRITRDLLRNSDYNIVRDKNNANCIVIPDFRETDSFYSTVPANIVAYDTELNNTYIFCLYRSGDFNINDTLREEILSRVKAFLGVEESDDRLKLYYDSALSRTTTYLIPPIEDYYDVLDGKYALPQQLYITDTEIPVHNNFDINIESLEMAKHMDIQLFEKFLISCPWQEYPFTLFTFMKAEKHYSTFTTNRNTKMVLEGIYYDKQEWPDDIEISAKDFNTAQDWVFHLLGVEDADKAFIDFQLVNRLHEQYRNILRRRFAVSKIHVDNSIAPITIRDMIK